MRDFSIDIQTENIYSSKTKDYFQEVIKSYYGESYRSAVVMLYSIAVSDLLYKIEELKEIYNDSGAIEILEEITDLQTRNPNSPEWETKLIELVKEKTNLLEPAEFLHLNTLQKHRHLCAHPVLTQNFELYRPNKETTRAHIRNILEGVLIKPPLLSRKIFDDILSNLSTIKTIIFDDVQLEKHLKAKYLNKLNTKTVKHIFRSLWKITFKLTNPLCIENREINLKALLLILKNDYANLFEAITNEKDYYSDIDVNNLPSMILLLNQFPEIFNKFTDSVKILTQNIIEKDADFDTFAIFLSPDIKTHIEKILAISWDNGYEKDYITTESILAVFKFALKEGQRELAFDFLIQIFGKSNQYSIADNRFDNLIKPMLNDFTKKELKQLVETINDNSQIHDRRKARSSNAFVRERITELYGCTFNFDTYAYFR
jgi:hypothetical protein